MGKITFQNHAKYKVLTDEQITVIHKNALDILENTGVHFQTEKALKILEEAGATVDYDVKMVRFPEAMVMEAIDKAPESFTLYGRKGESAAEIGGRNVYFDPGSAGIRMLESDGCTMREAEAQDLVKIAQVTEVMKNVELVSTALTPYDIPQKIGESFRVYALLKHTTKPFVTGAYSAKGMSDIRDLLAIDAGGREALREKPRALLDITAIAPLKWTDVSCHNIIDAAMYGLPMQLLSVPMIGAAAPATLAGCVLLHTVEVLSGLVLAQTVCPGTPVVYGGAPMYFDMRSLTTSLNAVEGSLISAAYAQMGKYYGMPTHTYSGLSDAKTNDSQAGLETAISGTMAYLSEVNVISGVGMLDFCNTFSLEKLVIDNEICGLLKRIGRGLEFSDDTLAAELIKEIGPFGEYLNSKHTLKWFRKVPYMPSPVIDRRNYEDWAAHGQETGFDQAKKVVADILENPKTPAISEEIGASLDQAWRKIVEENGELTAAEIESTFV